MESVIYLLKSTAILSLFFLVYEFLLKKETLYNHHRMFLLLGIFTAAILPYFSLQKKVQITQYVEASTSVTPHEYTLTSYNILTAVPEKLSFWESLNYIQILFGVYLLVVIFFVVKFSFSLWQLKSFLKNERNCTSKNGIKYIQTTENTGPFSFLKYIVYNPDLHNDNELKLILKHEEAHVKNYHSVDVLLANLLVFTHWFNPLAWLYRKRITQNLEFLADAEATENLNCPKAYQLSLLNYVKIDSSHLPVNNFHKSFINTRIKKLHQSKSHKSASLKTGFVLPLLIAFFLVFQVNSQEEIRYIEVEATPQITENKPASENKTTAFSVENLEGIEPEIIENKSGSSTEKKSEKQLDSTVISKIAISATILKTTTEASLKEIQKLLKKHKIPFEYSNLKYDQDQNLTQLVMSFKDKNGKNHSYSIFGEQPIPRIQLFVSDDFTGFKTFTNQAQTQSIDRNSAIIINGKPRSDFDKELKEVLIASNKQAENGNEISVEFEHNPSSSLSYIKSMNVIKNTGKEGTGFIIINDENNNSNLTHNTVQSQKNQSNPLIVTGKAMRLTDPSNSLIATGRAIGKTDQTETNYLNELSYFTVHKHISDANLKNIKNFFESHNIDFKSSIKRNKEGGISKIKIEIKDQNGKTSTTSYENNQGISNFKLGLKEDKFFVE